VVAVLAVVPKLLQTVWQAEGLLQLHSVQAQEVRTFHLVLQNRLQQGAYDATSATGNRVRDDNKLYREFNQRNSQL
jgi:hypothetical protein